jgi:FAS-associated factor 2
MASVMNEPPPEDDDRRNVTRARTNNLASTANNQNNSSNSSFIVNFFIKILLNPLRSLTGAQDICTEGRSEARQFVSNFEMKYGKKMPNFSLEAAETAYRNARESSSFFLVYLHSSIHDSTDTFCNNILCNDEFLSYINANFMVWGGDVDQRDAYTTARVLQATSFPFLGILVWPADKRNPLLLERVEISSGANADINVTGLIERFTKCIAKHEGLILASRRVQQERETRRLLREQQEREYNESLRADQEREEALKREADERTRIIEEEEERKSLKEAMELSKKLTQQQKIDEKTIRVGEEPEHNPKMNTRLQLKYPDGTRTIRRFSKTATLNLVCDFIDIEMITKNLEIENYSLNLNFPRRTFRCRDEETSILTLEEAGLHPQAVLFIQNLDA